MSKKRDCPFQMSRNKHIDGYYEWKLWDITTKCVVAMGTSSNPFNAPQSLRRIQAHLNTRYMLDKLRVC